MQREVTLYTVDEQQVMAYDTVSFHRQHRFDINATPVNADLTLATVERIDVPVKHYRERNRAGKWIDSFIAVDPKLEQMIQSPLFERLDQLAHREHRARCEAQQLADRINEYNSLPWYKRIFNNV